MIYYTYRQVPLVARPQERSLPMFVIALLLTSAVLGIVDVLVSDYNMFKWLSPYIRHIRLFNSFVIAFTVVLSM